MTENPTVYVIHENPEWFPPVQTAFEAAGIPVAEWLLVDGSIDLNEEPPQGIFWSRLSASAHTRGHATTRDFGRAVLRWLESWGRTVVNGSSVLEFEVSKVAQYSALRAAGIEVPKTTAVFGTSSLKETARRYDVPFIAKHNQGGKGLGVRRFDSYEEFDDYVDSPEFEPSPDDITLVQEYLAAREPFITRVEFAGGEYVYAVKVDTSGGSFELCPAEACAIPAFVPAAAACDVPGTETQVNAAQSTPVETAPVPSLFSLREDFEGDPLISTYQAFLQSIGASVAGIEFIETVDGRRVTYDINTNTNYNPDVEKVAPRSGPKQNAEFLGRLLAEKYPALVGRA